MLPVVAISMGDPSGIGPEIIFKMLQDKRVRKICRPLVVGDERIFLKYGFNIDLLKEVKFLNIPAKGINNILPGAVSSESGEASYQWVLKATESVLTGCADALVTAPITKEAFQKAGVKYCGHTELLGDITKTKDFAMMMVSGNINTVMVTRHIPICNVGKNISIKNILDTVKVAVKDLKNKFYIKNPKVGVCSLNPHSGESGIIGTEELGIIAPAVKK